MQINYLYIITFLLIFLSACGLPEHYFSPKPECESVEASKTKSKSHQDLIFILKTQKPKEYRYFFNYFSEKCDDNYINVNFRNEESCFDIMIYVDKWDKLGGMKEANGKSYPKELYDLEWEIIMIDGVESIKYVDMHSIID